MDEEAHKTTSQPSDITSQDSTSQPPDAASLPQENLSSQQDSALPSDLSNSQNTTSQLHSDTSQVKVTATQDKVAPVMQQPEEIDQCYETQFFGFTPKSFSDGMYNAVLEYTWDCLASATKYMQDKYPSLVSEEDVRHATDTMFPYLTHAIDKAFDKFESYLMTNICRIPSNVLLPEDAVHSSVTYSAQQEEQLDDDIARLEQQIKCAKYMNAHMRAEMKQCCRIQQMYDNFDKFLNEIDRKCHEFGVPDLREALVFNNEKAMKIRELLDKLREQHTSATPPQCS